MVVWYARCRVGCINKSNARRYGDAYSCHTDAESDAYRDQYAYNHQHAYANIYAHYNEYAYPNTHRHGKSHAYRDIYGHAYPYGHRDAYREHDA